MRWLAAVALLAAAALGVALRGAAEEPPPLRPLLKAVVDGGAPGALIYIRDDQGEKTAAAGHAQLAPARRLEPNARFRTASLTKMFTAAITLQLIQENRLRLESTLERLRPGLLEDGDSITIRALLSHRSGLYDHTDLPEVYNVDRTWTPEQLVALSAERQRQEGFAYSSTNYVILGLVIEAVTGQRYADVLRARITEPLGLDDTTYEPDRQPPATVHGHVPTVHDGFIRPATPTADTSGHSATAGGTAGAIVSTPKDIATFLDALLDAEVLLPKRLRDQMVPRERHDERSYGLGLVAHPLGCGHGIGHTGNLLGTITVAYRVGERTVVAMTNQHPLTNEGDVAFRRLVERAACG